MRCPQLLKFGSLLHMLLEDLHCIVASLSINLWNMSMAGRWTSLWEQSVCVCWGEVSCVCKWKKEGTRSYPVRSNIIPSMWDQLLASLKNVLLFEVLSKSMTWAKGSNLSGSSWCILRAYSAQWLQATLEFFHFDIEMSLAGLEEWGAQQRKEG